MRFSKTKVILPLFIILIIAVSMCINHNPTPTNNNEIIFLNDGDVIPDMVCQERGIKDKIIFFWRTGCPACAAAMPNIMEAQNKTGVDIEYINLGDNSGRQRAFELKIMSRYVPTLLIHCKAYVGYKSKDDFKKLLIEAIE